MVGALGREGDKGPAKYWQINGQAWDINDKTCADRPIASLKNHKLSYLRGYAIWRSTCPIHLHAGIKVISSNRKEDHSYFTDTYLPGQE